MAEPTTRDPQCYTPDMDASGAFLAGLHSDDRQSNIASRDLAQEVVTRQRREEFSADLGNRDYGPATVLREQKKKWLMSKAAPRRYGEKLDLNHSGAISTTDDLDFSYLDRDERAVLKELVLKAKALKEAHARAEAEAR